MPRPGSDGRRLLGVHDVRDSNEMFFLHTIRDRQPVPRTDLAKETGLRAGTVSVVVNRLIKAGFIYEAEEAPLKGGRRAIYLQVNAEKAYAIAVSIGVTETVFVVSDFNGRVLSQNSLSTSQRAAGRACRVTKVCNRCTTYTISQITRQTLNQFTSQTS